MTLVGLYTTFLAMKDPDTDALIADATKGLSASGIIEIDKKYYGSSQANITNFEGAIQTMPGNNKAQFSYQQPSQPAVAWNPNNLSFEILNKILGYEKKGLGWIKADIKPHVGLIIVSQTLDRAHKLYFALPNGTVAKTTQNITSDTPTSTTPQVDALSFTSLAADSIGGQNIATYIDSDTSFTEDAMFKEVFPDYVAPTTSGTGTSGQ